MAGRVQIETVGELGDFLTTDPSFSFFTKRYSKHTNFATENFKIDFSEKVQTGDFLDVPIPQRYGDILQEVTLSFVADPETVAELASNLFPVDIFGISVIEYVELYVGEQKIDTVTGDDIFIERELNIPESYRSSVDVVHGKHFQGSSDREFLQEFYDGQYNTEGIDPFSTNEYRIQIPFYFHRRPGHGFPLCSIYDQELTLRIKLRPAIDVLFATQEKYEGVTLWDPRANSKVVQQLVLSDFRVNLTIVHLNASERSILQNRPIEILFEQRQRNVFLIEPRSKTGTFKLEFTNCVKELYFIAKKFGQWTPDQISTLERVQELNRLTPAQVTILNGVRRVVFFTSLWGEIIRVIAQSLEGETDPAVRKSRIDVLRVSIVWGPTELDLLDTLESGEGDTEEIVVALNTYVETIPAQILVIQTDINIELAKLPGLTGEPREAIIDGLLDEYQSIWGTEQVRLLNELKTVSDPSQESLLILILRIFVTQISFFLIGLDTLPPGSPQQLNTINGIEAFLDSLRVQIDILKLGMIAVLETIPSGSRDTIINGLLRVGGLVWGEDQITLLNALRDPTIDPDPIIIGLEQYLIGVYDANETLKTNVINTLNTIPGSDSGQRASIIDALLDIPNVWRNTQVNLLNALRNPDIDPGIEAGILAELTIFINAFFIRISTLVYGVLTEIGTFPGADLLERLARVAVLRRLLLFEGTFFVINVVNTLSPLEPETADAPARTSLINNLIVYTQGLVNTVPSFQFSLNLLKSGVNGILDTLPGTIEERDPIIIGLITSHEWNTDQIILLNTLRFPGNENEQLIIDQLKAISTQVPIMDGISQFRQSGTIQVLLGQNIWGENYIPLNALRLVTPGFIGEENVQALLDTYILTLPARFDFLVNGIPATLDSLPPTKEERDPIIDDILEIALKGFIDGSIGVLGNGIIDTLDTLPPTKEERDPIIDGLIALGIWGQDQLDILDLLRTPDEEEDANRIAALKGYVIDTIGVLADFISTLNALRTPDETEDANRIAALNAFIDGSIAGLESVISTLSIIPTVNSEQRTAIIIGLIALGIWEPEQLELFEQLQSDPSPVVVEILVGQLIQYIIEILNTIKILKFGVRTTLDTINQETDFNTRSIIITILLQFPIWEPEQIKLLDGELRVVGSQNHALLVDGFVQYLDDLRDTAIDLLTELGNLLDATTETEHNEIMDTLLLASDTVWGGYFIRLLDELKNPFIDETDEESTIQELQTYVEIILFTESQNRSIKFLLRQLTVQYPEPSFNKWVRGKKHVPLMYSKQRLTTLTCDGTEIIGETTGSNLFLSACLPNIYHKRSPNFRNINMYSFALYPGELRPSGHLNFSTIKDAYINMELEYDGSHGTFDFDDNFIELFGIPRIDFSKQVIIIAKSYNMMIIRDGRAHILFTS